MIENPTAREIHKTMINFIPPPSITQNTYPALKWNKIWRNINSNELSSKQKTSYYLLVNEKLILMIKNSNIITNRLTVQIAHFAELLNQ